MRWNLVIAAWLVASLGTAQALAHSGALGGPPIEVPTPPTGDGRKAADLLKEVEGKAQEPQSKKLVADPTARAKKALERAHGARTSGDMPHAQMLDALALEWAETARDLLRAANAEDAAATSADKAREASTQVERARALLEETQARRGRAEADLERALAEEREAREAAAKAEEGRIAAGKSKDKKQDGKTAPKSEGKKPESKKPEGKKPEGKKGKGK